jgi:hypothetical protein
MSDRQKPAPPPDHDVAVSGLPELTVVNPDQQSHRSRESLA